MFKSMLKDIKFSDRTRKKVLEKGEWLHIMEMILQLQPLFGLIDLETLLRVSEANEVPISSHIWVGLSTFNSL